MGTSQPQSPAVRGFPRFGNRSLRCTLRGVFAVLGEREGTEKARDSGLFKVAVPQAFEEIAVFKHTKKCFRLGGNFRSKTCIFCAAVVNKRDLQSFENRTAVTKEASLRQRRNCAAIDKDRAAKFFQTQMITF